MRPTGSTPTRPPARPIGESLRWPMTRNSISLCCSGVSTVLPADLGSYSRGYVALRGHLPARWSQGFTPASGPTSGGTVVTIAGAGFTGATADGLRTERGHCLHGQLRHLDHSNRPSRVRDGRHHGHRHRRDLGTSLADQFTYVPPRRSAPSDPTTGPATGDTVVTVTGTNFTGATAVTFGTNPASAYTVNSPTWIAATTQPPSPARSTHGHHCFRHFGHLPGRSVHLHPPSGHHGGHAVGRLFGGRHRGHDRR